MTRNVHAVGIIIENTSGEILVLKRNKTRPEGNTWGLVGGKVEEKDRYIYRHLERQMKKLDLILGKTT